MRTACLLAALTALALATPARAQGCAPAQATSALEQAGVRATLFNNGALFWTAGEERGYEVPKGSGIHSLFTAGLWVAGQVNGHTRFAGTEYGPYEYWPGPLAEDGSQPTVDSCAAYDRIWRVTLEDIARYNTTGEATADLAEWPIEAGAPVVDGDGDPSTYDLAAGDRPAILGDETAWWVMNDRGDTHDWSRLNPIGIEVRVTAFTISEAYAARLGFSREDARLLQYATAYRYEITYRGDIPLADTYVGLFVDTDLGYPLDDYVGSEPEQDLAYTYNADAVDGFSSSDEIAGYGNLPPALGVRIVEGPAEKGLGCFIHYFRGVYWGGGPDAYGYLRCLWLDATPLTYGGTGYNTGAPTKYMFSERPPVFWSEMNLDGLGTTNQPGDRWFLASHGPFSMQPEQTVTVTFALPWIRSDRGHLGSVRELIARGSPLVAAAVRGLDPDPDLATITLAQLPVPIPAEPEPPELPDGTAVSAHVWPNPATGDAVLRLDLSGTSHVRLAIFDALGREVAVPVNVTLGPDEHRLGLPAGGLPPGVYHYRLTITPEGRSPLHRTGRFTLAR